MSDQDMFDDKDKNKEPLEKTSPDAQKDLFGDKLDQIKNEQGEPKYKDVDTALDALKASQQYIETLKQEKRDVEAKEAEARAELERMGNIDDFVKKLNPDTKTEVKVETPATTTGLSEEEVSRLLQNQLRQRDQESQQQFNLVKVTDKLSEVFGDKSIEHLDKRAKELGTTKAELKSLAMSNPNMALELLVTTPGVNSSPSQASLRSSATPNNLEPQRPTVEVGATRGGRTNKELGELWNKSKEYTNKRIGLES